MVVWPRVLLVLSCVLFCVAAMLALKYVAFFGLSLWKQYDTILFLIILTPVLHRPDPEESRTGACEGARWSGGGPAAAVATPGVLVF